MLLLTFALSGFGITWEGQTSSTDRALLFAEGFEDKKLASRGWYDGTTSCCRMMRSAVGIRSATTSPRES